VKQLTRTLSSLEREVLDLPTSQRAALADRILVSLDEEGRGTVDALWTEEVEHRIDEYDRGDVKGIPASEVRAKARRILQG